MYIMMRPIASTAQSMTLSVCQVSFPCTGCFLLYSCWRRRRRRRGRWWRNDGCHSYMLSTDIVSVVVMTAWCVFEFCCLKLMAVQGFLLH